MSQYAQGRHLVIAAAFSNVVRTWNLDHILMLASDHADGTIDSPPRTIAYYDYGTSPFFSLTTGLTFISSGSVVRVSPSKNDLDWFAWEIPGFVPMAEEDDVNPVFVPDPDPLTPRFLILVFLSTLCGSPGTVLPPKLVLLNLIVFLISSIPPSKGAKDLLTTQT